MTDIRILSKLSAALLLGVALAGSPAFADKGGGGHGGNGGGNSEHGNSGDHGGGKQNASDHSGHGKSGSHVKADDADDDSTDETDDTADDSAAAPKASTTGQAARAAGKLNGFLHASPTAIANASPKSALGKVRDGYGALLGAYLDPAATTKPTAAELAAALEAASNKPVTADVIARVNAKLMKLDPTLSANLGTKTPDQLAAEIAAAL